MLKIFKIYFPLLCQLLLVLCFFTACATMPDTSPKPVTEMIDGKLVARLADKMMRSLLNSPVMANSKQAPKITLLRFKNRSRFPLDGSIFLAKLRSNLNAKASGRIVFIAREHIEAVKNERTGKRTGVFSFKKGNLKNAVSGADYFLTGGLHGISAAASGTRSEYLLFTFYLVNAENTDILWEDQLDLNFKGTENAVYR
jgi:penicillin-binding protein activator